MIIDVPLEFYYNQIRTPANKALSFLSKLDNWKSLFIWPKTSSIILINHISLYHLNYHENTSCSIKSPVIFGEL